MTYRKLVAGLDTMIPISAGKSVPAVHFDNASTTPPLTSVMDEITRFVPQFLICMYTRISMKKRQ